MRAFLRLFLRTPALLLQVLFLCVCVVCVCVCVVLSQRVRAAAMGCSRGEVTGAPSEQHVSVCVSVP
jgi:hypothetical protein